MVASSNTIKSQVLAENQGLVLAFLEDLRNEKQLECTIKGLSQDCRKNLLDILSNPYSLDDQKLKQDPLYKEKDLSVLNKILEHIDDDINPKNTSCISSFAAIFSKIKKTWNNIFNDRISSSHLINKIQKYQKKHMPDFQREDQNLIDHQKQIINTAKDRLQSGIDGNSMSKINNLEKDINSILGSHNNDNIKIDKLKKLFDKFSFIDNNSELGLLLEEFKNKLSDENGSYQHFVNYYLGINNQEPSKSVNQTGTSKLIGTLRNMQESDQILRTSSHNYMFTFNEREKALDQRLASKANSLQKEILEQNI